MSRIRSSLALLVGCVWALGLGGTAALAADMAMPVKAPPPPPPPPSWWSGFIELDGESFLINPQGQALINTGTATLVAGLNLTLYKDKAGFINNVTVGGLLATDWSGSGFGGYWDGVASRASSSNGVLFDTVFILSQSVTFGQYWTLSNEYVNVYSQRRCWTPRRRACILTACSGFPTLVFDQVKLSLNDSFTGWPITFNPYVTWYYELEQRRQPRVEAVSAACFSCQVNNYDFFIGMTPTWDWTKQFGIPMTWKVPTYVTVGPASFWNGNPDGLGSARQRRCWNLHNRPHRHVPASPGCPRSMVTGTPRPASSGTTSSTRPYRFPMRSASAAIRTSPHAAAATPAASLSGLAASA